MHFWPSSYLGVEFASVETTFIDDEGYERFSDRIVDFWKACLQFVMPLPSAQWRRSGNRKESRNFSIGPLSL